MDEESLKYTVLGGLCMISFNLMLLSYYLSILHKDFTMEIISMFFFLLCLFIFGYLSYKKEIHCYTYRHLRESEKDNSKQKGGWKRLVERDF